MKAVKFLLIASIVASIAIVTGCSSSPSDQELQQLKELKDKVAALNKQISDQQTEKATLEKQIAEKNAKIKQCQADQEAVKKSLGK